jgi:hypothetical protein
MIGYKLTDQNMQTYGGCQWELGVAKRTSGEGMLCGPGWLHFYEDPLLAVLHNPIHAGIENPRLFLCRAGGEIQRDDQMKAGCTKMVLVKELDLPQVTMEQRVGYAILCGLKVCRDAAWRAWAEAWLAGEDRSAETAEAAAPAMASWASAEAAAARASWAAAAAQAAAAENLDLVSIARSALEVS